MKNFISIQLIENPTIKYGNTIIQRGWGNGYVIVPKGHPWYKKDYEVINCLIYGGLTYSQQEKRDTWKVGFDTNHHGDTIEIWTYVKVAEEALDLYRQAVEADKYSYTPKPNAQ